MKFIDDIDTLYKRWSTRIAASQGALVALFVMLPEKWQDAVPHVALALLAGAFALAIIGAQTVKQTANDISTKDGG